MRKRPIKRQRFSGLTRSCCLHELPNLLVSHKPAAAFFRCGTKWAPVILVFSLLLCSVSSKSLAAEPDSAPAFMSFGFEETNSSELLQAILQLQGQVLAQQKAIEENAREGRELAARNAERLTTGLQTIERAFSEQRQSLVAQSARELEAMQNANRNMLIVVAAFAVTGFLAMLITACFQWRMSKAWARISTAWPAVYGLGRHSPAAALPSAEYASVSAARVEDSNLRLLAAVERIEKRIQDLEQTTKPTLDVQNSGNLEAPDRGVFQAPAYPGLNHNEARISRLLSEGQLKWRENDLEAALGCFNEVLALNPNQSEALVRKGATLERLKKLNEAFECYDRAIAADHSMTIAYLHKGGLCNRLERFKEALECYEKALRTQERWGG